ncbi:MAG: 50S ribosomal protein L5 [Candidatus Omnitrophica bacterium]|nr:50S ribosomal protein L5 [Candidatus Omnitrophota bacterium]MDD5429150.1 50S ribosomal protein L5 [Candidatus Omnitrophota bacterium]
MSENDLNKNSKPRLKEAYYENILPELAKTLGCSNKLEVPRLVKIVVNMGVGVATTDAKIAEKAAQELAMITGQKAKICRARKPISNFKLRKGLPIGCCVTLRKNMMYEFLDRLISIAIPRIRDFRGFSQNSFDGRGNYTFGLLEQNIFPEVNIDKVSRTQGMNISIHTSALTDEAARELLDAFGFPFRK